MKKPKLKIKNPYLIDKLWERKVGFRLTVKKIEKRMKQDEKTN